MDRLSVVIITLNERENLPRCLAAIPPFVHEIIVVDSGSTDGTVAFCQANERVSFYHQDWLGFGPQKNVAFGFAHGDWILSLDADESLSEAFILNLERVLKGPVSFSGYEINRSFHFLGKTLRYGGSGNDWVLRLFRRKLGHCTPSPIHEKLVVEGPIGRIGGGIVHHFPYQSTADYFSRLNNYTTLMAQKRKNTAYWGLTVLAPARFFYEFFKRYFIYWGCLDGFAGFTHCLFAAFYHFVKYVKVYELQQLFDPAKRPEDQRWPK